VGSVVPLRSRNGPFNCAQGRRRPSRHRRSSFFRPIRGLIVCDSPPRLRRGLHSFAASRLGESDFTLTDRVSPQHGTSAMCVMHHLPTCPTSQLIIAKWLRVRYFVGDRSCRVRNNSNSTSAAGLKPASWIRKLRRAFASLKPRVNRRACAGRLCSPSRLARSWLPRGYCSLSRLIGTSFLLHNDSCLWW